MTKDALVAEVRAARDAFAKQHGYDIDAIFAALRGSPRGARARWRSRG